MQLLSDPVTSELARAREGANPRRRTPAWLAAIALVWLAGCGSAASQLVAPNDEYLAYRKIRTASELEARLERSTAYLAQFPHGQWAGEVQPWFERAELRFWLQRAESPAGWASYLRTLPDGPHAAEAKRELDDFRRRQRESDVEMIGIEASLTEERLAELQRERDEARGAFSEWLGRFLTIDTWGQRTSALDHTFVFAWRIDPPHARCEDDRCAKLVRFPYALPGGGASAARELVMDVVLVLDQGMVREARIEGPNLFSRLYEASLKRPVAHDDASARVAAIAFAVEVAGGVVEARLPKVRCARSVVAPVVLDRECEGWSIRVRAAEYPGEDDVVAIRGPNTESQPASAEDAATSTRSP